MYAHVSTDRLSSSDEVSAELDHSDRSGAIISDQTARTLASWYHSPSPRDRNLTALSHGLPFDTEGLRSEATRELDARELDAMLEWLDDLESLLSE